MAASVNVVANPSRRSYRRRSYRRPYRRRGRSYGYRRPYTRRRRAYRRPPVARRVRPRFSKFMLAQVDPFDERAAGAKIPDSNTMPSATFVANDETSLATGATYTSAAVAYTPGLRAIRYVASNTANGQWSWGTEGSGDASSRYATLSGQFQMYRVAAHGVRISVPTAPTSTVGFLHVAIYPNDWIGSGLNLPTNFSQMNQCTWYKRFTLSSLTQQTLTVVNKIMDCGAEVYRDIASTDPTNATYATFHSNGFATIVCALEGVPVSTTAIAVEHITHCEAIPSMAGVFTPSPAARFNVQELEAAAEIARETDATMLETERAEHHATAASAAAKVPGTLSGRVYSAVEAGVGDFVDRVGPGLVNMGLSYAGQAIVNNALPGVTNVGRLQN